MNMDSDILSDIKSDMVSDILSSISNGEENVYIPKLDFDENRNSQYFFIF